MNYENMRRVFYGEDDEFGTMYFIPICDGCGKFVKADAEVTVDYQGQPVGPNAVCKKCGPAYMLFEGYL